MPPAEFLLAVNCGSSSIKFKVFDLPKLQTVISGSASNVAVKGAHATIKYTVHEDGGTDNEPEEEEEGMEYDAVFERIISRLEDSCARHFAAGGKASELIKIIAHRVVHGGAQSEPVLIWKGHEEALQLLDKLSEFAPLHNHRSVTTVRACLKHLPESTQVLCFDTLFHSTLPREVYTYPLSEPEHEPPIPLRKYGAHGLSYAKVLSTMAAHLQKPQDRTSLVVAHLGSGASVCAIHNGQSIDTSMGVSPLDGLPGGTRTGAVDPVLIFHHTPDSSQSVDYNGFVLSKAELVMNKDGGLQALAGTSDFGEILKKMDKDERCKLAYDVFADRVAHYVSAYICKLLSRGVLDGIVFSGGIGEHAVQLRADVGGRFAFLGAKVDQQRNEGVGKQDGPVTQFSTDDSMVALFVCETDEETQCAEMARDWVQSHGKGRA